jgi:Topoisomerase DNA binding C4 zinc finger
MARRNEPNAFAALMDLVARLPWWAGVGFAVLSYFLLHAAATQTVLPDASPGQITSTVAQSAWKSLATIGQYLVPFACLAGAAVSIWRRKTRNQLRGQDKPTTSPPDCPLCAKPMARRTAKRGTNAGREFWGCTGYPACRGTREIA